QPDNTEVTEDGTSLSAVELSVAGLILEQLGNCLQEAWMGSTEMVVELSAVEKDPGKKRVFRYGDLVTKTGICLELPQGRLEVGWVLPKQAACDLLDQMADHRELPSSKKPNESTVGKLPIELVAVLGKANMTMASLANLKVGELVLLDQWIDSPIPMLVNEKQHYRCWPGRLGSFQAVEVSDCQDG
ncbi:MAG: FliM/FliN family flagellar motor switch protein, partial [bacterium]|nr:FliM/FliN family flagellar motor switch protein [bacterium]